MQDQESGFRAPTVGVGMCTFYPNFREMFLEILQVLLSRGEAYTPDTVLLGRAHGFRTATFSPDKLDDFFRKWKDEEHGRTFWKFERKDPGGLTFSIGDTMVPYSTLLLQINRDYLAKDGRIEELLGLLRDLYSVIHPFYGAVWAHEIARSIDSPIGKVTPGIDPQRGLPEIEWANFLGPEYVEMYGAQKLFSAPFHSIENLPDGGVLLLLSPSPFDLLSSQEKLEKRRFEIKKYLGLETFDTGDPRYQGRVPKFRYEEDWKAAQAKFLSTRLTQTDILSTVSRRDWEDWMENNETIAMTLVSEMKAKGFDLNFSGDSLDELDTYIERQIETMEKWSISFIRKLGAYLAQVIFKTTDAVWYFPKSEIVPSLEIRGAIITPLVRVVKVLEQGEKLSHWYRSIIKMIPQLEVVSHDKQIRG